MLLKPNNCRECPCFKSWRDVAGGVCQVMHRGLYDIDEAVRPPHWCPARDGVTIVVVKPISKEGN